MSARGEVNKVAPQFVKMIRSIARTGLLEKGVGVVPVGTRKTLCYVCEVHDGDDPDENLRWTVDVMDVNYDDVPMDGVEGYHPGVMLCASTTNANGFILVPELYSEVIIERNPETNIEYVSFVSRVAEVRFEATNKLYVGRRGFEDFSESDDGIEKDYFELEETGDFAYTEYSKDGKKDVVTSGSDSTEVRQTHEQVFIKSKDVQVNGGKYHAVLFEELEIVLRKLIQYLATATAAGSPLSTAANISALTSELSKFKSNILKINE